MKIQYLGTAAAEGIPGIFCECEVCKKSWELGGKNIRTRSQALLDDTLLIDFPPDTYMHYLTYKFPLTKIKHCIITHSHQDHLYPDEVFMRKDGPSHLEDKAPMRFYACQSGYDMIKAVVDREHVQEVEPVLIRPFQPFEAAGYTVTPLEASHTPNTCPVVFIIEKDGKSIFYSNDTSEYPEETWEYLRNHRKPCTLISLDCTEADGPCDYVGHMNLDRCTKLRECLLEEGIANEDTVFVLNHFSHNGGNVVYDDFVKLADARGFIVTYDGMEIEF